MAPTCQHGHTCGSVFFVMTSASVPPLRVGILGAARIAPAALIHPARHVEGTIVTAVAARDRRRAIAFAHRHSIPVVYSSYQELIDDADVDIIYNPLPNGLHGHWSCQAMAAGKSVLCEKPLAANADEAGKMVTAASATGVRLVEAFHYRYHRLIARTLEILASGEIGDARHYEANFIVPIFRGGDIRYRFDLAGGATMDLGCYLIHLIRTLAGAEPRVVAAEAIEGPPNIDRGMRASLRFDDGRSARFHCSMWSPRVLRLSARVEGTAGSIDILNPIVPHIYNQLRVTAGGVSRREHVRGPASYTEQLRALVQAIHNETPLPTGGQDSIANMRVIDAVYEAAGLPLRHPTPA